MEDLSTEQLTTLIRRLAHEGPHTYALPFIYPAVDAGLADFFAKPDEIATIGVQVRRDTLSSGSGRYVFYFPPNSELGAIRVRVVDERTSVINVMFSPTEVPLDLQELRIGVLVLALKRFIAWFYKEQRDLIKAAEEVAKHQPPPPTANLPTLAAVGAVLRPVEDELDRRILQMVTEDPDLKDEEIGREIGLTRQAVNARRKRLQAMGHKVR